MNLRDTRLLTRSEILLRKFSSHLTSISKLKSTRNNGVCIEAHSVNIKIKDSQVLDKTGLRLEQESKTEITCTRCSMWLVKRESEEWNNFAELKRCKLFKCQNCLRISKENCKTTTTTASRPPNISSLLKLISLKINIFSQTIRLAGFLTMSGYCNVTSA